MDSKLELILENVQGRNQHGSAPEILHSSHEVIESRVNDSMNDAFKINDQESSPSINKTPVSYQPKNSTVGGLPFLNSIADLGAFKGRVSNLIPAKIRDKCIVLDLKCAEVAIVCTKMFYGSGAHTALLSTIPGRRYLFKVTVEYFASEQIIEELNSVCDQKSYSIKGSEIINETNRFIVLYDDIVRRAVELKTTDIHFEISDNFLSAVRLRIYGRLKEWKTFPTELIKGALTAAYSKRTKSGTNSGAALSLERAVNTITEQDLFGKQYNGRLSGYPVVNGYDVVMRLLENDPKGKIPTIESLGYSEHHVQNEILPAIARNEGIILIAGSTGSGKSTAIRSFIYCLPNRDELKIYGVEDPVEYLNPFMRQISIQRNTDDPEEVVKMKFLSALRSLVRMDPDVIMLGEIRDKDSAEIASEFTETGHRAFSTAHGNGAVDVLKRLTGRKIGIDPETLGATNFLSAVMYQKLLPKLCPHCKIPALKVLPQNTIDVLRNKFYVDAGTMFCANKQGCEHCRVVEVGIAGTKGLTVVAEILIPTLAMQEAIQIKNWAQVEALWRGQRQAAFDDAGTAGKTAFEHALYKACAGIIDPQDIETDFMSFSLYRTREIILPFS
jgi:type II secretory ATPase GspE/PulE/Tfp pilus assembly ATPase PilB-like protein